MTRPGGRTSTTGPRPRRTAATQGEDLQVAGGLARTPGRRSAASGQLRYVTSAPSVRAAAPGTPGAAALVVLPSSSRAAAWRACSPRRSAGSSSATSARSSSCCCGGVLGHGPVHGRGRPPLDPRQLPPDLRAGRLPRRRLAHDPDGGLVTVADAILAFPIAYYMARVASPRARNLLVVAVLLPLWASYLVKAYAWRTILSDYGRHQLGARAVRVVTSTATRPSASGSSSPTSGCRS